MPPVHVVVKVVLDEGHVHKFIVTYAKRNVAVQLNNLS